MTHGTKVKVIFHFKIKIVFVRADGLQEFGDIVGVQGAGLCGHPARKVCVAYMSNSLNEQNYSQKGLLPLAHSLSRTIIIHNQGYVFKLYIYINTHTYKHNERSFICA